MVSRNFISSAKQLDERFTPCPSLFYRTNIIYSLSLDQFLFTYCTFLLFRKTETSLNSVITVFEFESLPIFFRINGIVKIIHH